MYENTETGESLSAAALRKKHKNTSFPLIGGERRPSDEWLEDNGYVKIERQIADVEAQKASEMATHLASYTMKRINEGVTVSGVFIATTETDRALINGAVTRALLDGDESKSYPYYPTGGGSVRLTNAQYKAVGRAIADHVQRCLDVENSISVSDFEDRESIEQAFDDAYDDLL